jgi:hypothetical protein
LVLLPFHRTIFLNFFFLNFRGFFSCTFVPCELVSPCTKFVISIGVILQLTVAIVSIIIVAHVATLRTITIILITATSTSAAFIMAPSL